jgi:hypothetical protein
MAGGGLLQLVAYGAQDVYFSDSDFNQSDFEYDNEFTNQLNNLNNRFNSLNIEWHKFERPIKSTDKNNECPITLEKINLNDTYCMCLDCNYIFNANGLKIALQTHNECPMCLSEWKSPIEYVNK